MAKINKINKKKQIKSATKKPLTNKPDYQQPLQFNIEKEIVPDKIQPKKIFDLMGATTIKVTDNKTKTKTKTKTKKKT
tara:strand:- start:1931 stop:2164 length:234 start_codon:yes stop_codon:yes gene_type:complete